MSPAQSGIVELNRSCLFDSFIMADPVPSTFVEVVVTVEQLDGTVVASGSPPATDLTEVTVHGLDN